MFVDHQEEKDVQSDVLQETFINSTAGWVNLLLLSSSGPIKVPVGACVTALQSVEIACDTILSGKAKVMITGGYPDTTEEGIYEFAVMKAASNSNKSPWVVSLPKCLGPLLPHVATSWPGNLSV